MFACIILVLFCCSTDWTLDCPQRSGGGGGVVSRGQRRRSIRQLSHQEHSLLQWGRNSTQLLLWWKMEARQYHLSCSQKFTKEARCHCPQRTSWWRLPCIQCQQDAVRGGAWHWDHGEGRIHWIQNWFWWTGTSICQWYEGSTRFWQMYCPLCLKQVKDHLHFVGGCFLACVISSVCISASNWPITTKSSSLRVTFVTHVHIVADREGSTAWFAIEVLTFSTNPGKLCNTVFFQKHHWCRWQHRLTQKIGQECHRKTGKLKSQGHQLYHLELTKRNLFIIKLLQYTAYHIKSSMSFHWGKISVQGVWVYSNSSLSSMQHIHLW